MKSVISIFILYLTILPAIAGTTIYCSHEELCQLTNIIAKENQILDLKTETLVNISGDPHEYEPSTAQIKKLINAPVLISGPNELNPWIKKINFQRSKLKTATTISLILEPADLKLYSNASPEALSHFWLYPRIYCSLKSRLESELIKNNYKIKNKFGCNARNAETALQNALSKISRPIILTHDALLPLLQNLSLKKQLSILAIKGSGHHEEATTQSIKKMYDALKFPQVIWIQEVDINIPSNILNKIRSQDQLIKINTAKSSVDNPFSVILDLADKLNKLSEK